MTDRNNKIVLGDSDQVKEFKNKSFLKLLDFNSVQIQKLLNISTELKRAKKQGRVHQFCKGKNIALIFEKNSTRTRCAFEVASYDLGAHCTFLDPSSSQIGKKESIKDTARVLGSMFDAIEYRGFDQSIVEELSNYSNVPVYNGLTNQWHPTQVLADFLTILEEKGRLRGLKFVFMGDARYNMARSLMVGSALMGMDFVACCPRDFAPDAELVSRCKDIAASNGSTVSISEDPSLVSNADVVYTDVWVSMGEKDEEWEKRIKLMKPYQVNDKLMSLTKPDSIFLHCLPSFHNTETSIGRDIEKKFGISEMEVTDSVFEGPHSRVFLEAENRLHTIKAVIYSTLL